MFQDTTRLLLPLAGVLARCLMTTMTHHAPYIVSLSLPLSLPADFGRVRLPTNALHYRLHTVRKTVTGLCVPRKLFPEREYV